MAKKKTARKIARKPAARRRNAPVSKGRAAPHRRTPPPRRASAKDPLLGPVTGADSREVGHVKLDVGRAGSARVKRMIYPPGFRWSTDMKPIVGTELCMHAHVGFLAKGEIHIEYADGCVIEHR